MKIEVWSDYVCPFCYIGKRQLEMAITQSGYEGQIEIELKSFLLDPTTPIDTEQSVYEALAEKYKTTEEQIKSMTANVALRAKEVGLTYQFDQMKNANTTAAHRLAKWAKTKGLADDLNERILKGYFLEGAAIGKEVVLLQLAEEVGLNRDEAKEILNSSQFAGEVEEDIYEAQNIGVRGVPFFVIDRKYGISGAQEQSLFNETIKKAAEEAGLKPKLKMVGSGDALCADDHCNLP